MLSSFDIKLNDIKDNIPEGLSKLCGNVQTILIATLVPSTINVVLSIIKDQSEDFVSMILIFTLIIISIGLLFYSLYVYTHSDRSLNIYFVYLYSFYILTGLYIMYNFHKSVDVSNLFLKKSHYIDAYSDLSRILLSSLVVFVLLFAFININYDLYAPTNSESS